MKTTRAKAGSQDALVRRKFVEAEGFVHLVGALQGEHTLCGDAFDLDSDVPGYEWKPTAKRVVTCPNCALVIEECRGVRTRSPNAKDEARREATLPPSTGSPGLDNGIKTK